MEYLAIGGNQYDSSLPTTLATLSSLEYLFCEATLLTGNIDFITKMPMILEFWGDFNMFSGTIQTEIGRVTTLTSLSLSENQLWGEIPSQFGALTQLGK